MDDPARVWRRARRPQRMNFAPNCSVGNARVRIEADAEADEGLVAQLPAGGRAACRSAASASRRSSDARRAAVGVRLSGSRRRGHARRRCPPTRPSAGARVCQVRRALRVSDWRSCRDSSDRRSSKPAWNQTADCAGVRVGPDSASAATASSRAPSQRPRFLMPVSSGRTRRERREIGGGHEQQQHAVAGDQRQVLRHAAEHRAEQVGAEGARARWRSASGCPEQQAGAADRAEHQQRVDDDSAARLPSASRPIGSR